MLQRFEIEGLEDLRFGRLISEKQCYILLLVKLLRKIHRLKRELEGSQSLRCLEGLKFGRLKVWKYSIMKSVI